MWISEAAIRHPIPTVVFNLLLVIFGLLALSQLAVREFPKADNPVISVETLYPGASAYTVEKNISQILETHLASIEGLQSILSKSEPGISTIMMKFSLSTDIQEALNNVRNEVYQSLNALPPKIRLPQITPSSSDNEVVIWLDLSSKKLTVMELSDYARRYLLNEFSVIPGVAKVVLGGEQKKSMRIWINPVNMQHKNISIQDIIRALESNNIERPSGYITTKTREFSIHVNPVFNTEKSFEELIVKQSKTGEKIRLKDIARIDIAPENSDVALKAKGVNLVSLGIKKASNANLIAVSKRVQEKLDSIKMPKEMSFVKTFDASVYVKESLTEVTKTLIIAFVLVALVVYLFLGSIRVALIPLITIPVSIIASFMLLQALGYSINTITLLSLVISIGLVVDDALIMVEVIERRVFQYNEPPILASHLGALKIGFAVIATTSVLLAVLVPAAYLGGVVGKLFIEFAATMAGALIFSSINALSLTPVLCCYLIKNKPQTVFYARFLAVLEKIKEKYRQLLRWVLQHKMLGIVAMLAWITLGSILFIKMPYALFPKEDRGLIYVLVRGPENANFHFMEQKMRDVEKVLMTYYNKKIASQVVTYYPESLGVGEIKNTGFAVLEMVPLPQRTLSTEQVYDQLQKMLNYIPGISAIPILSKGFSVDGIGQSVQMVISANDHDALIPLGEKIVSKLKHNPMLKNIRLARNNSHIQFSIDINYQRAAQLGVDVKDILGTLEVLYGSFRASYYRDKGKNYDIILEADKGYKNLIQDIHGHKVRSRQTQNMIPLSEVIRVSEQQGSNRFIRYNGLASIVIHADYVKGYKLSQAISDMQSTAYSILPKMARVQFKGSAAELENIQTKFLFMLGLTALVMYLILAAQFSNFIEPFVILITAPISLVAAIVGLYYSGDSFNLYSQLAMVMLVGLSAKNGILIVEYISQHKENKRPAYRAIIEACCDRLRPILMTTISSVIVSIPLLLSTGSGAEARATIGRVLLYGVSFGTLLTLIFVPLIYSFLVSKGGGRYVQSKKLDALQKNAYFSSDNK